MVRRRIHLRSRPRLSSLLSALVLASLTTRCVVGRLVCAGASRSTTSMRTCGMADRPHRQPIRDAGEARVSILVSEDLRVTHTVIGLRRHNRAAIDRACAMDVPFAAQAPSRAEVTARRRFAPLWARGDRRLRARRTRWADEAMDRAAGPGLRDSAVARTICRQCSARTTATSSMITPHTGDLLIVTARSPRRRRCECPSITSSGKRPNAWIVRTTSGLRAPKAANRFIVAAPRQWQTLTVHHAGWTRLAILRTRTLARRLTSARRENSH